MYLCRFADRIDTDEGSFDAHVAIEARWFLRAIGDENDLLAPLPTEEQLKFDMGKVIKLPGDHAEKHWHPQLRVLNLSRDHNEQIIYTMRKVAARVEICEFRDLRGCFFSTYDLRHYPHDVQELSVAVGSALAEREVILEIDACRTSGVNDGVLHEQQEWQFYKHVDARVKLNKEFVFQNEGADGAAETSEHEKKRPVITVACHAGTVPPSVCERLLIVS